MKKVVVLFIMFLSFNSFGQLTIESSNSDCFTQSGPDASNNYTFNSIQTAQCSNCYHWSVTPISPAPSDGLTIIGSNTTRSISVHPNAIGEYNVILSWFDNNGECHNCSRIITVTGGPCGCTNCEKVCMHVYGHHAFAHGDHETNPEELGGDRDLRDENLNDFAGITAKTEINGSCSCIAYIDYSIEGEIVELDGAYLNPVAQNPLPSGVHIINQDPLGIQVHVDRSYLLNHDNNFGIFAGRSDNVSINARIHFTNGYETLLMVYHVNHGDAHDPQPSSNCWEPIPPTASKGTNRDKTPHVIKKTYTSTNVDNTILYPNPTSDIVNIKFDRNEERIITVLDMQGYLIKEFIINKKNVSFSVKKLGLKHGLYFVKIKQANDSQIKKLIIE